MRRTIPLILSVLMAWGCEIGPDGQLEATGTLTLSLTARTGSGPAGDAALFEGSSLGNISLDDVAAINVTITAVDVLPTSGGTWLSLDLAVAGGVTVDLMALSAAEVVIATATLPADDYVDARLFVENGTLVLSQQVCLGQAAPAGPGCLAEGVDHSLLIPSADQTGIKTDAHFTIAEGGADDVTLVFEAEATVRNIAWAPGLGEIIVEPVIRVADGTEE